MPNKRNGKRVINTRIDQPQQVLLPGRQNQPIVRPTAVAGVLGLAPEHDVVRVGRGPVGDELGLPVQPVGRLVVVVLDHVGAEVNVVVGRGRTLDDQGPDHAVAVLVGVVAVVPRRAVLRDVEGVALHLSGGDGTLGHAVGAVLVALAELADAVPVD